MSLKSVFVSHRGQDINGCGNWTLPCRSVRHAVKISSDNDVIHIDYANGRPYKECEQVIPKENHTIMLNKSLSFHGFNGQARLHCEKKMNFFRINSSGHTTLRIVFFNLSLVSRAVLLNTSTSSRFELEFDFCDIQRSAYFIRAVSLSCSIHLLNSSIHSYQDPIYAECTYLTVRLNGSTFFSCMVTFSSKRDFSYNDYGRKAELDVHIYNCTFIPINRQLPCDYIVGIDPENAISNIRVEYSVFLNFYNLKAVRRSSAFCIFWFSDRINLQSLVLDSLHFENITCYYAVVNIRLSNKQNKSPNTLSIVNSRFLNTTRAFRCVVSGTSIFPKIGVWLYNNIFNITHGGIFGNEGSVYLVGGSYTFSLCHFFQYVPDYNPEFSLIHFEDSPTVEFRNCEYETYLILKTSRNGNSLTSNYMFYAISFDSLGGQFTINGLAIICPKGYMMNLHAQFSVDWSLYTALCVQCPRNTYSLDRGKAHDTKSNNITCHECPVGGNCVEGQVLSKPNFWGYESSHTVQFLQCPPKYCCDTDDCLHYDSCHGNRIGTLCGECPTGMSESLFNTKCRPNNDCTSVLFWPGVLVCLILYLLFFLYQEDIVNFILRRIISRLFWPSSDGRNSQPGGSIKIIFYYYQVVHLLRNSVGSNGKAQLFDDIENSLARVFIFLVIDIPSFDCPFEDLRPVQKAIIVHSVGYSLLILLCLLYLFTSVFKLWKKLRTTSPQQPVAPTETMNHSPDQEDDPFLSRIAGAFTNISLLTYASTTQLCLSLLHCVPVGDSQVLFLDGHIQCYQTFQYFLLAYMISSILPFCFVPVLGSYLLKLNRISVGQFCLASIFPLPFCCYWSYLLVRSSSWWTRHSCRVNRNDRTQDDITDENSGELNRLPSQEIVNRNLSREAESGSIKSAVLRVLLGAFRPHKAILIFPASHLPWEGFLILRRLAIILVLTFVYDNRVKATLAMMLFGAILLPHVFIKPFKTASDNVLETLSLVTLVIISGFSVINSIYYGEDLDSSSSSLLNMVNLIQNILTISPIALILSLVVLSILLKLVTMFRFCFQVSRMRLKRVKLHRPSENSTSEERRSLLSQTE